ASVQTITLMLSGSKDNSLTDLNQTALAKGRSRTIRRRVSPPSSNRVSGYLASRDRVVPETIPVTLKFQQCLEAANRRIDDVRFFDAGLAWVLARGGSERVQAELAALRREGMTGVCGLHAWWRFAPATGAGPSSLFYASKLGVQLVHWRNPGRVRAQGLPRRCGD